MKTTLVMFDNNSNIGLYGYCTDEYCLLGSDVPKKMAKELEHTLGVPVHYIKIAGTGLIGAFCAGNSKRLLIPDISFPEEREELDKLKIPYSVIKTKQTCLGNNCIISDDYALLSEDFLKTEVEQIKKALGVPVKQISLSGISVIGSLAAMNKNGCLVSHDVSDEELVLLEKTLKREITTGTLNFGNTFIRSSVLVNSNGMGVGASSGGPELVNAEQAFKL